MCIFKQKGAWTLAGQPVIFNSLSFNIDLSLQLHLASLSTLPSAERPPPPSHWPGNHHRPVSRMETSKSTPYHSTSKKPMRLWSLQWTAQASLCTLSIHFTTMRPKWGRRLFCLVHTVRGYWLNWKKTVSWTVSTIWKEMRFMMSDWRIPLIPQVQI